MADFVHDNFQYWDKFCRIEVMTHMLQEACQPKPKRQKTEHSSSFCTPSLDQYKCCPCQSSQESGYRTSLGTSFGTPSFTTASMSTPLPVPSTTRFTTSLLYFCKLITNLSLVIIKLVLTFPIFYYRSPDLATKQRIADLEQMVQMLKDQIGNMATQIQLNQSMYLHCYCI